jgi:hypothetical protein
MAFKYTVHFGHSGDRNVHGKNCTTHAFQDHQLIALGSVSVWPDCSNLAIHP